MLVVVLERSKVIDKLYMPQTTTQRKSKGLRTYMKNFE